MLHQSLILLSDDGGMHPSCQGESSKYRAFLNCAFIIVVVVLLSSRFMKALRVVEACRFFKYVGVSKNVYK